MKSLDSKLKDALKKKLKEENREDTKGLIFNNKNRIKNKIRRKKAKMSIKSISESRNKSTPIIKIDHVNVKKHKNSILFYTNIQELDYY